MDAASVIDELSIILMYLNPFLAKLPDEAREGLCQRMRLESINRDQTIYKQGDELQSFFLILSGQFTWCPCTEPHGMSHVTLTLIDFTASTMELRTIA